MTVKFGKCRGCDCNITVYFYLLSKGVIQMEHKVTTFFFNSNIFPFLSFSSFAYYLIRHLRSHKNKYDFSHLKKKLKNISYGGPPKDWKPPIAEKCPGQRPNCESNPAIDAKVVCKNKNKVHQSCQYSSQDCAETAGFSPPLCRILNPEHDCYTSERFVPWNDFKRRWCCNNMGLGCDGPTSG